MSTYTVGYFVGSLSSTSINRTLAEALIRLAPADLEFVELEIRNLPLYSQDYDADYPPEAVALKEAIAGVDAVLFVSPEYNRSIPGALKNAIDIHYTPEVFGDDGTVNDASTEEFLRNYMTEFRNHIHRVLTVLPR